MPLAQVDTGSPARSGLAWHPDGSLLAVAGPANNIVLYERLSWHPVVHLEEGHTDAVNCLQFSPNGARTLPLLKRGGECLRGSRNMHACPLNGTFKHLLCKRAQSSFCQSTIKLMAEEPMRSCVT